MRNSALLVALFLAISALVQGAPQETQRSTAGANPSEMKPGRNARKLSEESIEIAGATLRLGMTKDEVAAKLVGSDIIKVKDDSWVLGPNAESVMFSKGVLVYADRYWRRKGSDLFQALYGVASLFNQEGLSLCTLHADTLSDPGGSTQHVLIHCGRKSILVLRDQTDDGAYQDVVESLGGDMPDTSK